MVFFFPKIAFVKLLIFDLLISEWHYEEICSGWEHAAARFEELLPCNDESFEHPLIQKKDTERLTDHRVNLLWQIQILNRTLNHSDDRLKPISFDQFARIDSTVGSLDSIDLFGASLCSEHTQDARSTAHIQHDLALVV
jgi:hypothetical protein